MLLITFNKLEYFLQAAMFRLLKNSQSRLLRGYASNPKPFSELPSPKGALPVVGHYFRIKNGFNKAVQGMFEEVQSPIFKLKLPGMGTNQLILCRLALRVQNYIAVQYDITIWQ